MNTIPKLRSSPCMAASESTAVSSSQVSSAPRRETAFSKKLLGTARCSPEKACSVSVSSAMHAYRVRKDKERSNSSDNSRRPDQHKRGAATSEAAQEARHCRNEARPTKKTELLDSTIGPPLLGKPGAAASETGSGPTVRSEKSLLLQRPPLCAGQNHSRNHAVGFGRSNT